MDDLTDSFVKTTDADIRKALIEAVLGACKQTLNFDESIGIEGLIGITIDDAAIMLVSLKKRVSIEYFEIDSVRQNEESAKNELNEKITSTQGDSIVKQDSTESDDAMSVSTSSSPANQQDDERDDANNQMREPYSGVCTCNHRYKGTTCSCNLFKSSPSKIMITSTDNEEENNSKASAGSEESDKDGENENDDNEEEEKDNKDGDDDDDDDDDDDEADDDVSPDDQSARSAKRFKPDGSEKSPLLAHSSTNQFSKTIDEDNESSDTSLRSSKSKEWGQQKAKSLNINGSNSSFEQDSIDAIGRRGSRIVPCKEVEDKENAITRRGSRIVPCKEVADEGPSCSAKKQWIKDRIAWISLAGKDGQK